MTAGQPTSALLWGQPREKPYDLTRKFLTHRNRESVIASVTIVLTSYSEIITESRKAAKRAQKDFPPIAASHVITMSDPNQEADGSTVGLSTSMS